ncbi:EAL domain-containing protein [Nitrospiraceae bacterium HYJII51-Mn-bac16s-1-B09]|uniref:EAL domain-containing protein n=2 Tax=Candidatus Manganitrophus noduliformans TaxID=2606439 RepID=A0A7X6DU83_9BACT|nr:GGDEF domain-containing response regulator [Candidatus Manganitrophus noduliformans]NKE73439.1 EAL domain-containing protein [Candidatus Manganitrophus noduliformans]
MGEIIRVLIIEDSYEDAELLTQELIKGGYDPQIVVVDTAEKMAAALDQQAWDIVFSDYSMPHFNGGQALLLLREDNPDLPFIFVSGTIGEEIAVAAMRTGANDYIIKGNLKRLVPTMARELDQAKLRREHRKSEVMVKHLAYHDALTVLPNRTLLQDRLQAAITAAQFGNYPLALLLMDLNRFKEINDTLGHHRGDYLLQQVGLLLSDILFEPNLVARLGGDEFAVLLPRLTGKDDIHAVAQKILHALEKPMMIEGLPIEVELGIGIAIYPDHGANPETLLQRADVAMYTAKENGNGYAIYEEKLNQYSPRRLVLLGELRHAIDKNELLLHFQPKVDLESDCVVGVEALARWQHPEHGFIPPNEFIIPAEKSGLIKPLTQWVLNAALQQCHTWQQQGIQINVAVNLSRRNLQDSQLPDLIAQLLLTYHLEPTCLGLEITESSIMSDPTHAVEVLTRLSGMGIQISIDDFGTGYSSLSSLAKLPVSSLKIDKSFILGMTENKNAMIVKSTIGLAHHLGLNVVAEGVESGDLLEKLSAFGCDEAQGYFISRPVPAEDLTRWLRESSWRLK